MLAEVISQLLILCWCSCSWSAEATVLNCCRFLLWSWRADSPCVFPCITVSCLLTKWLDEMLMASSLQDCYDNGKSDQVSPTQQQPLRNKRTMATPTLKIEECMCERSTLYYLNLDLIVQMLLELHMWKCQTMLQTFKKWWVMCLSRRSSDSSRTSSFRDTWPDLPHSTRTSRGNLPIRTLSHSSKSTSLQVWLNT